MLVGALTMLVVLLLEEEEAVEESWMKMPLR